MTEIQKNLPEARLTNYGVLLTGWTPTKQEAATIEHAASFDIVRKIGKGKELKTEYREYYLLKNGNYLLSRELGLIVAENKKFAIMCTMPKYTQIDEKQFARTTLQLTSAQKSTVATLVERYFNPKRFYACNLIKQPGTGKTYIAIGLLRELRCKMLYVTPDTNIIETASEAFAQAFPDIRIGFYNKSSFDLATSDVVFITIQSLSKGFSAEYSVGTTIPQMKSSAKKGAMIDGKDWIAQFGMTIYDEVDCYVSHKYKKVFDVFQTRYMMGMTGTPHTSCDPSIANLRKIYELRIGELYYDDAAMSATAQTFDIHVLVIKYKGADAKYTKLPAADSANVSTLIGKMCRDPVRAKILAQLVAKFHADKSRQTLLLADRRSYLKKLHKCATTEKVADEDVDVDSDNNDNDCEQKSDSTMHLLYSGTKKTDVKTAFASGKTILSTYKYLGTGTSIPRLNTLILATPRKYRNEQFNARILRAGSESHTKLIIDFVDSATFLCRQFLRRREAYEAIGARIVYCEPSSIDESLAKIDF